ncbi:MAG TPA: APC family permease [Solirubrobacterales bacterium]|nr:APC family permease [Solirubrobacterales bacterium]
MAANDVTSSRGGSSMLAELIPPKVLPKNLGTGELVTVYFAIIFGAYGASQLAAGGWAVFSMLGLAVVVFLIPAILASYELGTLFPGEGGIYIWADKTMGKIHGFIAGWLSWVAVFLLLPLVSTAFAQHLQVALGVSWPLWATVVTQVAVVSLITLLCLAKLDVSMNLIKKIFFVAMGTAVVALVAGVYHAITDGGPNHISSTSEVLTLNLGTYGFLFSAAVLWLIGVEIPFNMGAEFKDQKKGVGRMLTIGTVALLFGYICGILGTLLVTPIAEINPTTGVAEAVKTVSGFLGVIVALGICAAVLSQGLAYMNAYSRLLFVSGIERRLPRIFAHVGQRSRQPVPAILLQAVVAVGVIALFFSLESLNTAFQLYIATLIVVWSLSLFYLYTGIVQARRNWKGLYEERGDKVWKIPGGNLGVGLTALVGTVGTIGSIYYVFKLPFTEEISAGSWRLWVFGLCAAAAIAGVLVFLVSEVKNRGKSVEDKLAELAVDDPTPEVS